MLKHKNIKPNLFDPLNIFTNLLSNNIDYRDFFF